MIYDQYAAHYDQTGQLRFSILIAAYLPDLLHAHPIIGSRLLDLACGTGTFAIMQAEQGWQVWGLDRSPAMLAEAQSKAALVGVDAMWIAGDMRTVQLSSPIELVTCWYDSLNYLLDPADVRRCADAVYATLLPGGAWFFDVATPYFLQHHWCGVEVYEAPGYTQVMQSSYADPCSTLVLTGCHEYTPGHWQRFREVHVERGYPIDFWVTTLRAAGFVVEACYDCFTLQPPNERSLRVCWVARKSENKE